jgi:hypothetical protein
MSQCAFVISWVGSCKEEALEGSDKCAKHAPLVCDSCGQPATHDCEMTLGPFTCGSPLCNDCEHTLDSRGVALFSMTHSKVKSNE